VFSKCFADLLASGGIRDASLKKQLAQLGVKRMEED